MGVKADPAEAAGWKPLVDAAHAPAAKQSAPSQRDDKILFAPSAAFCGQYLIARASSFGSWPEPVNAVTREVAAIGALGTFDSDMPNNAFDAKESRREFLKKVAFLAASGSLSGGLAASIQRAYAIEPKPGSTFHDAEHVVILMQENRSFDHVYGMLRGVRGFNDPRAVRLPNGNPVWLQTNASGDTYGPFHFDLKKTNATWIGGLPHRRRDQLEARNGGKHDQWLVAKFQDTGPYTHIPATLGYYDREDLPFHYGLADAFTICDQAFCSVLSGTTSNRLHLWTGGVRPEKTATSLAHVENEDTDFGHEASWKTFPERLEENGISWKTYQNELAVHTGLTEEEAPWLSNFGDNPLEVFTQYGVYFSASHRRYLQAQAKKLNAELDALRTAPTLSEKQKAEEEALLKKLQETRVSLERWSEENFSKLPERERQLHRKAFVTNAADSDYRELATLRYRDGEKEHEMKVPKSDVLHEFRQDVINGTLPTVSWLVPPERFSDHPSNPWYGALIVSEALDILTKNPDVWRKTIFILCYDENDGYFDHVPPFVPPHSKRPETGKASAGMDTSYEYVEEPHVVKEGRWIGREGPIGLGYRVPLVIASPWSRGGYVNSEVFDHTSILRFLETFLTAKTGKKIREDNISEWRRVICGDLTSSFRVFNGEKIERPEPLARDKFLAEINRAQFRPAPESKKLGAEEIAKARTSEERSPLVPRQEKGTRPSCALPQEFSVNAALSEDGTTLRIDFAAEKSLFGERSAGGAFHVYSPRKLKVDSGATAEVGRTWAYAVLPGDRVQDSWNLGDFEYGNYALHVHGPNGFLREFAGSAKSPRIAVSFSAGKKTPREAELELTNDGQQAVAVSVDDKSYGRETRSVVVGPGSKVLLPVSTAKNQGWYDFIVRAGNDEQFLQRFAGRVEDGTESISDPAMA